MASCLALAAPAKYISTPPAPAPTAAGLAAKGHGNTDTREQGTDNAAHVAASGWLAGRSGHKSQADQVGAGLGPALPVLSTAVNYTVRIRTCQKKRAALAGAARTQPQK